MSIRRVLSSERAFTDFITAMEKKRTAWARRNAWHEPVEVTLRKRYDTETEAHRLAINQDSSVSGGPFAYPRSECAA